MRAFVCAVACFGALAAAVPAPAAAAEQVNLTGTVVALEARDASLGPIGTCLIRRADGTYAALGFAPAVYEPGGTVVSIEHRRLAISLLSQQAVYVRVISVTRSSTWDSYFYLTSDSWVMISFVPPPPPPPTYNPG